MLKNVPIMIIISNPQALLPSAIVDIRLSFVIESHVVICHFKQLQIPVSPSQKEIEMPRFSAEVEKMNLGRRSLGGNFFQLILQQPQTLSSDPADLINEGKEALRDKHSTGCSHSNTPPSPPDNPKNTLLSETELMSVIPATFPGRFGQPETRSHTG